MSTPKRSRYFFIAALLLLLFNYPLLSAANKGLLPGGLPVLYVYVLVVWLAGILLLFIASYRRQKKTDE